MSDIERTYEARALAIHYFTSGGLPFVDRAAVLAVVVDAEDEIGRLRALLARVAEALEGEMALAGPVPFDPEEIRKFLGASG